MITAHLPAQHAHVACNPTVAAIDRLELEVCRLMARATNHGAATWQLEDAILNLDFLRQRVDALAFTLNQKENR